MIMCDRAPAASALQRASHSRATIAAVNRRDFLRAGFAGAAVAPFFRVPVDARPVLLVADPADPVVSTAPVRWALAELAGALRHAGVALHQVERIGPSAPRARVILAAGHRAPAAATALARAGVSLGDGPERLALLPARAAGGDALLACGSDARGLTYALLEIADRVRSGAPPPEALAPAAAIVERPANAVRSVMRQFTSHTLDFPWFADREMWPPYLTMLATHRFNRLHLGFGLGYDALQRVADSYFLFLYPFLVDVPGYRVRVTNLADAERDRNLALLRYISEQTVARGLTFQLGVWMHGHQLMNSPQARHVVEGLTPETHAAYCRDALTALLVACPAISAVALRIHGESGIAEGSYDFWGTVFDGVPRAGRPVEIDLHAKGLDQPMIDRALATGMPVNVSTKCWAEHLGMPYHQGAIRGLEMPVAGRTGAGLMTMSEGARSFTRYGYADFLREDRRYTVRHRVFNGTQRLLLSGDPAAAAAYARTFQFCGSTGVDFMEPLTCRGRRGTGAGGGRRNGYADVRLDTRWDWEKFAYWYRVNGRLTYNPDAGRAQWRRHFGGDARTATLEACLLYTSTLPTNREV